MFVIFHTSKDDYRCRLSTRAIVECEDVLGENPVNVVLESLANSGKLPRLRDLLIILFYAIKDCNHGVKKDDIFDIFDDYTEAGGDIATLVEFLGQLFEENGMIGRGEAAETTGEETATKN